MKDEGAPIAGFIGAALLVVSYFLYPDAYHQFFQWLQEGFFDALNSSFGNQGENQGGRGQK